MNDAREEIKARLPVEDVVGQYVELKKSGRNWKGHSPWGVDKTPSFVVSPDKGIWHDFSANKGGDIFSFVMEVEGLTFREALEKLARQAGVELQRYSGGDMQMAKRKARAREALEWATKYYQFTLSKNQNVCEYVFYKRNMNKNTVKEFRIGYAPRAGRALINFLKSKGYSMMELEDAGLLNQYGGDLFRGRMMVPFIDTNGVIGFTARVLDKSEPKYLNTPETFLFNKSRFIFGLAQAKEAIRRSGFCVIVEGNMDVISSHQAGVKEAVATSGTAMTEQHLKALSRLTSDIRLAYDGDEAGVKATERAIKMAGELGLKLTVISDYQGAKDPDELIQRGPELWQAAVAKPMPAVEWLLKKYAERYDLTTADGKQEYANAAVALFAVLPKVQQVHYRKKVARQLEVEPEDLGEIKQAIKRYKKVKMVELDSAEVNAIKTIENNLLALVSYGGIDCDGVEMPEDRTRLAELEVIFEEKYQKFSLDELKAELKALVAKKKQLQDEWEIKQLQAELTKYAEDEEKTDEILRKIKSLQNNK